MSSTDQLHTKPNKRKGSCSVSNTVRQLHLRDETVHQHGPLKSPCLGSHKVPVPAATLLQQSASQDTSETAQVNSQPFLPTYSQAIQLSSDFCATAFEHPFGGQPVLKHIPKSVRSLCSAYLTNFLRKICTSYEDLNFWAALFNFGYKFFAKPSVCDI